MSINKFNVFMTVAYAILDALKVKIGLKSAIIFTKINDLFC